MESLKNIVFDFGGVLIDWNPIYLYRKIFDKEEDMNYFLEHVCRYDWNVLQDAGRSLEEGTRILQEQHPEYSEEIAMYYGRWDEMLGGIIEKNVKLIQPLKQKYNIYGLTNWSAETIPVAMDRYDFFKDLDGMVVSGAEKIIKPDLQLYRILMDRYQIQAEESFFIDDNQANVIAAQQLGFQTIHLTEGINLEEILKERAIL